MSEHTPEPWKLRQLGYPEEAQIEIDGGQWTALATVYKNAELPGQGEANARRIVACVNACKGIPTHELEESLNLGLTLKGTMLKVYEAFEVAKQDAETKAKERDEASTMVKELSEQLKKEHEEAMALWIEKYKKLNSVHNPGCCHSCDLIAKAEAML